MDAGEFDWGKYSPDRRYWITLTFADGATHTASEAFAGDEVKDRVGGALLMGLTFDPPVVSASVREATEEER